MSTARPSVSSVPAKIGALFARIAAALGPPYSRMMSCRTQRQSATAPSTSHDEIWEKSDIISLHCPLFPTTRHIVNEASINKMKKGVVIINTSRGGLIETASLVEGLKSQKIGGVGLDVFEGEGEYFYSDHSGELIPDDTLARLFTFSNVIITGHQAFFTKEALGNIAKTTMDNIKHRLSAKTAALAEGCEGVVIFVNDTADAATLRKLYAVGVRVLFLRCAGFDMVDLEVAKELDMPVLRVPAYSPYAVAEHAAALMMTLNRNIHRAHNRTRELNFRLGGLLGFDVHGKTIGVVGTGKIGALFARIAAGFGATVLAYDVVQNPEAVGYGAKYVTLDEIWEKSDIISLHCPLFPTTRHIVNEASINKMKKGVVIINTSRGGLIETASLVEGLKSQKIGGVGLDVFEGEGEYFYSITLG
ncbi:hypothetical protein Poli38472_014835 [Pythium oligandrum]|uniref:D-isomer specific 2-hydroxyacid dehydrogenase NAD-binding domain-containing protein n=1 Tax=Pythium oligandrum TaxID=41045 RepID=A0A8K1CD65_PYTOL|nr:hypothetical protein Poli38472_014835 [Pythium oligandrum]|eukprot:TMW60970.1 hypothetical protein Poli38472_014835 [Pythium oligandrum]